MKCKSGGNLYFIYGHNEKLYVQFLGHHMLLWQSHDPIVDDDEILSLINFSFRIHSDFFGSMYVR